MSDTRIKPISIIQIEILYENGTRMIIAEEKTSRIGKLFFDLVKKEDVNWKIVEPGQKDKKFHQKVGDFFKI